MATTYLSSYESQVLWAIFRKTYGWHKKEDWITGSQLVEMTGIAKGHISRTLKKLVDRNMVNKNGKKLSFQKDYDKWIKLPKRVTNIKLPKQDRKLPKRVTEVTQIGQEVTQIGKHKRNYTKETSSKETIQKKSDIFINAWNDFKEMRKKNNKNKPMTGRAEEMILNKLTKLSSSEKEQIDILNESTMNDWKGIFPLKENKYNKPKMTQEEALAKMEINENESKEF